MCRLTHITISLYSYVKRTNLLCFRIRWTMGDMSKYLPERRMVATFGFRRLDVVWWHYLRNEFLDGPLTKILLILDHSANATCITCFRDRACWNWSPPSQLNHLWVSVVGSSGLSIVSGWQRVVSLQPITRAGYCPNQEGWWCASSYKLWYLAFWFWW